MKYKEWITEGFEDFRAGTFGNGGQNLYISKKGILQRIHQTDINRNGFIDLVFCNSQNHEENEPVYLYPDPTGCPELVEELDAGGTVCGTVADLTGDGFEDLIVGCNWDGENQILNSSIFFNSEEGLSKKYQIFLPAPKVRAVAAGDFTGNGRIDLAFLTKKEGVKIFYQKPDGFHYYDFVQCEGVAAVQLCAVDLTGDGCSDLFFRREDGSCFFILSSGSEGITPGSREIEFLDSDPDFVPVTRNKENYTQSVDEPFPQIATAEINGTDYLFISRNRKTLLYPILRNGESLSLGTALVFNCENAMAVRAGDLTGDGNTDLVFACRDKTRGREHSCIYYGSEQGFSEDRKLVFETYHACDVVLEDFSGNGFMDVAIGQAHTERSYTAEVLIFRNEEGILDLSNPVRLPAHDANRIFAVKNGKDKKPALITVNARSGSLIGDADAFIYFGSAAGYSSVNRQDLPAWGVTDMVCCDLTDNGFPDLVFSNASELSPWLDPGSYIYHNGAEGITSEEPDEILNTTRAHGVVCGDLNHNGYLDLVLGGFDNPFLKVFYGSAQGFSEENSKLIKMEYEGNEYREVRFIALADLNNDGYLDLILPQIASEESFVLFGGPDGFSFDNCQKFNIRHACNAKVADLNGNGFPDLIFGGHTPSVSGPHDSFTGIYWGSADGYKEERRTSIPCNAVNSIAVADFNNNGQLDLFLGAYEDGRYRDIDSHIYWNQDGVFKPGNRTPLRTHAVSGNVAADFTERGWIDLAVANHKVFSKHISYSTIWRNGPDGFHEKNTLNLPSMGIHGMGNVDVGNIMDRSPDEYYISVPYESDGPIVSIGWEGDIPAKTWVKAQLRTADTRETLEKSPWMGPAGKETWFSKDQKVDRYYFSGKWKQYKLKIGAFNSLNTPRIKRVVMRFL